MVPAQVLAPTPPLLLLDGDALELSLGWKSRFLLQTSLELQLRTIICVRVLSVLGPEGLDVPGGVSVLDPNVVGILQVRDVIVPIMLGSVLSIHASSQGAAARTSTRPRGHGVCRQLRLVRGGTRKYFLLLQMVSFKRPHERHEFSERHLLLADICVDLLL